MKCLTFAVMSPSHDKQKRATPCSCCAQRQFCRASESNETEKIFSHSSKNCEGEIKQSHTCDGGSSGCWGQRKLLWEGDAGVQFCLRWVNDSHNNLVKKVKKKRRSMFRSYNTGIICRVQETEESGRGKQWLT